MESGAGIGQRSAEAKGEQRWHEGGPLFPSFSLGDLMHYACVVSPKKRGGESAEHADIRNEAMERWV